MTTSELNQIKRQAPALIAAMKAKGLVQCNSTLPFTKRVRFAALAHKGPFGWRQILATLGEPESRQRDVRRVLAAEVAQGRLIEESPGRAWQPSTYRRP